MNLKQKMVVVLMDVLLLAELAVAIYLGVRDPDNLTVIFLKTYVPTAAVTVVAARICIRRLASRPALQ